MSSYNHCDFAEYDELPQLVTEKCFLPGEEEARVNCLKKKGNTHCPFLLHVYRESSFGGFGGLFRPEKVSKSKTCENLLV